MEILQPAVGALLRHGLVRDIAVGTWDYIPRYGLTEFGVLCLDPLQAGITRTQATGEDQELGHEPPPADDAVKRFAPML